SLVRQGAPVAQASAFQDPHAGVGHVWHLFTLGGEEVTEPRVTRLRRTNLRGVVNVDQAEPGRVPTGPLEVVYERPVEVPAQVDAVRDGTGGRGEVRLQEGDPGLVWNPDLVGVRAAVLGD